MSVKKKDRKKGQFSWDILKLYHQGTLSFHVQKILPILISKTLFFYLKEVVLKCVGEISHFYPDEKGKIQDALKNLT